MITNRQHPPAVLAAISAGGMLGAVARYLLGAAVPHAPGHFPWATFVTNVSGCFLIGLLMTPSAASHRLLRPFLGTGVLGGFTTFSTYAVETRELDAPTALAYALGTLVAALAAAYAGSALIRLAQGLRPRRRETS